MPDCRKPDQNRSVSLAFALCVALWLPAACNPQVLELFFDGVNDPPPPSGPSRQELLGRIDALSEEIAAEKALQAALAAKKERSIPPIEATDTWEKALALLPTTESGDVDWMEALRRRVIAPRPGVDVPPQHVLELEVELNTAPGKMWHVQFGHESHTEWLSCASCHPGPFPLTQRDSGAITMNDMATGQYCGLCHGPVVFGTRDNCSRCHTGIPERGSDGFVASPKTPVERVASWQEVETLLPKDAEGSVDWVEALEAGLVVPRAGPDPGKVLEPVVPFKPVVLIPEGDESMRAVFPHRAHTQWLSCKNCHTKIYRMRWGQGQTTMEQIEAGKGCGVCHGTVVFGPSTNCARCHPGLE